MLFAPEMENKNNTASNYVIVAIISNEHLTSVTWNMVIKC